MKKKKFSTQIVCMILSLLLVLSLASCSSKKPNNEEPDVTVPVEKNELSFDEYMETLLKEDITSDLSIFIQFVENPDNYGITDYNKYLAGPSKENFDKETKQYEERLAKLTSYDYNSLTDAQKLDYDFLKTTYENRIEIKDCCYYHEPLSTLDGDHIVLPGILGLHAARFFETLSNRGIQDIKAVDDYFYINEALGNYLKEVAQFEREKADNGLFMPSERAKSVIEVCQGIIDNSGAEFTESFDEEIDQISWLSDTEKQTLKDKNASQINEHILTGYQEIINAMKECSGKGGQSKGLYETDLGKKYYAYILKSDNNMNLTPEETIELLDTNVAKWVAEKEEIINENPNIDININKKLGEFGDTDAVIQAINTNVTKDFPDIKVNWGVKDMPEAMNGFAMGLFYPQPLDSTQKQHFIYQGTQLTPGSSNYVQTIGHEGVPGHLYNYCYFMNLDISTYRKFIGWVESTGTLEGWTTYIEEYVYHYMGLNDQEARYLELNRLLELGLIQRVDLGVNYEGWSIEDISKYFKENEPMYILISGYVKDIVQDSINSYGPYCMGYIKLTDIKAKMKDKLGDDFSDLKFHEQYLNVGPATFESIEKTLLGE